MITIPVAAPVDLFKWQISLFQHQHIKCYGTGANDRAIMAIVKRNHHNDLDIKNVDWDLKLPFKLVESIFQYTDETDVAFCASNVFYAAWQVIEDLDDDVVVEVQDADIFHMRPYMGPLPEHGEVIVNTVYENWHMHIGTPNAHNSYIIQPLLKDSGKWYPNGGFNTIVRVGTLRKIIKDIVDYSIEIGKRYKGTPHAWWQQMYGLNIACHNNDVHMISMNNCYFPNMHDLDLNHHHQAHYSCDPLLKKHEFPNVDFNKFPNNLFYNQFTYWAENVYNT